MAEKQPLRHVTVVYLVLWVLDGLQALDAVPDRPTATGWCSTAHLGGVGGIAQVLRRHRVQRQPASDGAMTSQQCLLCSTFLVLRMCILQHFEVTETSTTDHKRLTMFA
jgi:hypothetical protein